MKHRWTKETYQDGIRISECKIYNTIKYVTKSKYKHFTFYTRNDITFCSSPTCVDDNEDYKGKID